MTEFIMWPMSQSITLYEETLIRTLNTEAQVNSLVSDTHQCARREIRPEDTEASSSGPF